MKNVMVDLETTGLLAGSCIVSIGAVYFDEDTGKTGPTFYQVVNLESCQKAGLTSNDETMQWWAKQSDEARAALDKAMSETSMPLDVALAAFNVYLGMFEDTDVKVWGNGANFDNAILEFAFDAVNFQPGWRFYNNRCLRTLRDFAPHIGVNRVGTHHNALDDAMSQAMQALEIFKVVRVRSCNPVSNT